MLMRGGDMQHGYCVRKRRLLHFVLSGRFFMSTASGTPQ